MARIVTNSSALTVFKNYNRAGVGLASSAEKLATGLRINRASDDAAGLAISETLRAQVKGANMAGENIANANAFINTADGYLQNVSDILGRLEELAIEYADPTKSTGDKANLSVEFTALKNQISSIGSSAKYNGLQIFNGSLSGLAVDANGTTLGVDGLTALSGLTASITAVSTVQADINTISTQRGTLGASQSRLNYTLIGLENYSENVAAAEGRVRNTDMASETTNFAKYQILNQAGLAMLGQANAASQSVLRLLG